MRTACRVIVWNLWLVFCASCSRSQTPIVRSTHLTDLPAADVYPLANGSALAVSGEQEGAAIFLLSQKEAIRVSNVPGGSGVPEVFPLADGSAYLLFAGVTPLGIYRLEGSSLSAVHEVTKLSEALPRATPAGFLWADRISAQTRKAREEREAAEAAEDARQEQESY